MDKQPESRSAVALGFEWASRVTTIGMEFALPAMIGYGVDSWLHTAPAVTIVGAVVGFILGMLHAVRMTRQLTGGSGSRDSRTREERGP